jgi:hypothetical protein
MLLSAQLAGMDEYFNRNSTAYCLPALEGHMAQIDVRLVLWKKST